MFAVIFTSIVTTQDKEYFSMLERMRKLAFSKYDCLDIVSMIDGDKEITISYWRDMKSILKWKKNVEHKDAQEKGKSKWYSRYKVEVVEIKRTYAFSRKE